MGIIVCSCVSVGVYVWRYKESNRLASLFSSNKPVVMFISIFNWLSMWMTSSLSSLVLVLSSPQFASFVSFVSMLAFRCSFKPFALPHENCSHWPSCSRLFSSLSWCCSIFSSWLARERYGRICRGSIRRERAGETRRETKVHQKYHQGCGKPQDFKIKPAGIIHLDDIESVALHADISSCINPHVVVTVQDVWECDKERFRVHTLFGSWYHLESKQYR